MQEQSSSVRKGALSTLIVSFLHFDLSFALWVLLGALGVFIAKDLKLNIAQVALIVALPTLSGAIMRIVIGFLTDRVGAKRVGVGLLLFLFLPLLIGWLAPINFSGILGLGLMLGVAGSSFAVSLPLASRWYPPARQGLVMGIAAAGNSGTVIANLAAPPLANAYGWHAVFALSMLPLALVLLAFFLLAKESPDRPAVRSVREYLVVVQHADLWWFCLFYSVTFGGFVGLSTFLPAFLKSQYGLNAVIAGLLTALIAFMGSTQRPIGGYLADKFGGVRVLSILLAGAAIAYCATAVLLSSFGAIIGLFIIVISCLGMGNGAIFQLVPQRFRAELGIATGIVGAAGGIGGFLLPTLLGNIKQTFHSFGPALIVLGIFAFAGLVVLRVVVMLNEGWRFGWKTSPVETPVVVEAPAVPLEISGTAEA